VKHELSKDWTAEERLVLMAKIASMVQSDIPAGNYSAATEFDPVTGFPTAFRPNCQSIIEIGLAPRWLLERSREDLQKMLDEDNEQDPGSLKEVLEKLWSGE
jgi:hypothetical protein